MAGVRDYARLARLQTASVELGGLALAGYLGGAPLQLLPLYAGLGVLIHVASFGSNSLHDWLGPYDFRLRRWVGGVDRVDPNKQHHPLNTGAISPISAALFVYLSEAVALAAFVFLDRTWSLLPVLLFLYYVGAGNFYNLAGKSRPVAASASISTAFGALFAAFGTLWTGRFLPVVVAVGIFAFLYVLAQQSVLGSLKELGQLNEPNLLRRLGTRLESDLLVVSPAGWAYSYALAALKAAALAIIAELSFGWSWAIVVLVLSAIGFGWTTWRTLRPGPFRRAQRMRELGLSESVGYVFLVLALLPSLGPLLALVLILAPVAWYTGCNRWLWASGSVFAPGV